MTDDEFWDRFWEVAANGDFEKCVIVSAFTLDDVMSECDYSYPDEDRSSFEECKCILRKALNWHNHRDRALDQDLIADVVDDFFECKKDEGDDFNPALWASV